MITMRSQVSDVMTHNVVAVRQIAEFTDMVEVMRRRRVSAFPVIDADDRVIGIVSGADLLPREAYPHQPADHGHKRRGRMPAKATAFTAGELMTSPAITITAEASVAEAAKVMYANRVKRLPVVDEDGSLTGIVSRVDLLGVYDRPDEEICDEITQQVIAGDFAFGPNEFTVTVSRGVATIVGRMEREEVALGLLQAVWDVEGVVDVRDRLSYPKSRQRT
jgi:CBS domain-containing protein